MDDVSVFLSPAALGLAYAWNFLVLASIQLSVRLIRAFSVGTTLLAAVWLTAATVPITIGYHALVGPSPAWLPVPMAMTGGVGYLIAARVLRLKRRRSRVVASIGIALLSAPWGAFLVRAPA